MPVAQYTPASRSCEAAILHHTDRPPEDPSGPGSLRAGRNHRKVYAQDKGRGSILIRICIAFHVFGTIAHFEQRLMYERTRDGIAAARRSRRRPGRPSLVPLTVPAVRTLIEAGLSPGRATQAHRLFRGRPATQGANHRTVRGPLDRRDCERKPMIAGRSTYPLPDASSGFFPRSAHASSSRSLRFASLSPLNPTNVKSSVLSGSCRRAAAGIASASANFQIFTRLTFRSPRSTSPT